MGGFLTALAGGLSQLGTPAAQGLSDIQRANQQATNRASFGQALNAPELGNDPEIQMMRQMFNAGASPEAVTSIAGGPVGQSLINAHMSSEAKRIFGNYGAPDFDMNKALVDWGSSTGQWDPFLKSIEYQNKPHAASLADKLHGIQQILDTNTNLTPSDRALGESAITSGDQSLADEFLNKVEPKYAGVGKDTSPFTPDDLAEYSKADPKFGQVARDYPTLATQMPKKDFLKFAANVTKQSPAEASAIEQGQIALGALDRLKTAGDRVLPSGGEEGTTLGFGTPLVNWIQEHRGVPAYKRYEYAQTAIIPHLRALANTGKVNGNELALASDALTSASTAEALNAAVDDARAQLQEAYRIIKNKGYVMNVTGQGTKDEHIDLIDLGTGGGTGGIDFGSEPSESGQTEYPNPGESGPSDSDWMNNSSY